MSTVQHPTPTFPKNAPPLFNPDMHREHRMALFKKMDDKSLAIIIGGTFQMRNGDTEHPYRPGSNLFLLYGI